MPHAHLLLEQLQEAGVYDDPSVLDDVLQFEHDGRDHKQCLKCKATELFKDWPELHASHYGGDQYFYDTARLNSLKAAETYILDKVKRLCRDQHARDLERVLQEAASSDEVQDMIYDAGEIPAHHLQQLTSDIFKRNTATLSGAETEVRDFHTCVEQLGDASTESGSSLLSFLHETVDFLMKERRHALGATKPKVPSKELLPDGIADPDEDKVS